MFRKVFFKANVLPIFLCYSIHENYERSVLNFSHPDTKLRIRGEYENKIRTYSTPEKIFETFATLKNNNILLMSRLDLFKSICPFNFSNYQITAEDLKELENGSLIKFVDINHDGFINIYEFMILVGFLEFSNKSIQEYFQKQFQKGEITKEGFIEFLKYLRDQTKMKLTFSGALLDPRAVKLSKEKYDEAVNDIAGQIFENKSFLKIDFFLNLKRELLQDVYKFEFYSYKRNEKNEIELEDFSKSLIAYLEPNIITKHLAHLEKYNFGNETISFQNYINFHEFFRENYSKIEGKLKNKGVITKNKLKKMIEEFKKEKNAAITNGQIDLFIYALDLNSSNAIETNEFLGIIKNRSFYGDSDRNQVLRKPVLSIWEFLNKSYDKAERIWEIIKE